MNVRIGATGGGWGTSRRECSDGSTSVRIFLFFIFFVFVIRDGLETIELLFARCLTSTSTSWKMNFTVEQSFEFIKFNKDA